MYTATLAGHSAVYLINVGTRLTRYGILLDISLVGFSGSTHLTLYGN
jgi:hypothetical protein